MPFEFDCCRCLCGSSHRRAADEIKFRKRCDDRSVKHKCSFACKSHKKRRKKHKCRERGRREHFCCRPKFKGKKLQPKAPFNSNQFLMEEHDNLTHKDLSVSPLRRRDSIDSNDHDETSAEDQFLTKEFWSEYEDLHAESLDNLPKYQLVQEFLSLEEKISAMERELNIVQKQDRERIREPSPAGEDEETNPGEVPVDAETAAKIEIFTSEIKKLETENEALHAERVSLLRSATCLTCGFPSDSRSISSSDSSDEGTVDINNPNISVSNCNTSCSFESNTDSGMASLEGNTSSSSEESRYYICDKSVKGFVSSTTS